jgi:hypothetical protein
VEYKVSFSAEKKKKSFLSFPAKSRHFQTNQKRVADGDCSRIYRFLKDIGGRIYRF